MYCIFSKSYCNEIYFKALINALTILERLDFEGGVYRGEHMLSVWTLYHVVRFQEQHNSAHAHTCITVDPLPCGKILKAVSIGCDG